MSLLGSLVLIAAQVAGEPYRVKPLEFPPENAARRITGDLVKVDAIRRAGELRVDGSGELKEFTLLPFGNATYLNAEADLRDLAIGLHVTVLLYADAAGAVTRASNVMDDISVAARQGSGTRLVRVDVPGGILEATRGSEMLTIRINEKTRVWKGAKESEAAQLAEGDELWVNYGGRTATGAGLCTEIYAGVEAQKAATARQRKKQIAWLKERGLPCWVDRVEGMAVTVTVFSNDRTALREFLKGEHIEPGKRVINMVVANEELRTYNPPVDHVRSMLLKIIPASDDAPGSYGERWVIQPGLLLEGFRKGRVLRLFPDLWPIKDMPRGENLYDE
ncbi:MAG TPA: hypothetical protein VKU80_12825 [Planctomycetota bacterium]|nr:hypothetical protein [Planctomycetota bacterium]